MSENNLPTVQGPSDMAPYEVEQVNAFIVAGMPGLMAVTQEKIDQMFEFYMSGDSYTRISQKTRLKKDIVLFLSIKNKWCEQKAHYLNDIKTSLAQKLEIHLTQADDFLINIGLFFHKYYNSRFEQYIKTGDDKIFESLDLKKLTQYYKSLEIIAKLKEAANDGSRPPLFGVSVPHGGTVTKINDNTIEVSASGTQQAQNNDLKSVLQALADLKRAKDDGGENK